MATVLALAFVMNFSGEAITLGLWLSTQNLAIGAAAVGMSGREGEIFRKVLGWSIVLVLIMCLLVYLQSKPVLS